jgi:glycosyltransferase involved in cell wall biosynthesis
VVFFAGFLSDDEYRELIRGTSYYVNCSHAEGLCMPLMEFLSAGRPAIAPDYTAMADYIDPRIAFVLSGSLEHNVWPFDPRDLFITMRYRLNWETLVTAYEQSYALAMARDERYDAMSASAKMAMRVFCAEDVVRGRLAEALGIVPPAPALPEISPENSKVAA